MHHHKIPWKLHLNDYISATLEETGQLPCRSHKNSPINACLSKGSMSKGSAHVYHSNYLFGKAWVTVCVVFTAETIHVPDCRSHLCFIAITSVY